MNHVYIIVIISSRPISGLPAASNSFPQVTTSLITWRHNVNATVNCHVWHLMQTTVTLFIARQWHLAINNRTTIRGWVSLSNRIATCHVISTSSRRHVTEGSRHWMTPLEASRSSPAVMSPTSGRPRPVLRPVFTSPHVTCCLYQQELPKSYFNNAISIYHEHKNFQIKNSNPSPDNFELMVHTYRPIRTLITTNDRHYNKRRNEMIYWTKEGQWFKLLRRDTRRPTTFKRLQTL